MPMQDLAAFVREHTLRGDCQCGRCVDAPDVKQQPTGHTVDMIFFKVAAQGEPDAAKLRQLVTDNKHGEYGEVDLFDREEHNYIELGAWIGDQGLAMQLMGLGTILGLWKLLSPRTMLPGIPDDMAMQMAGVGMLSVLADTTPAKEEADDRHPAAASNDQ